MKKILLSLFLFSSLVLRGQESFLSLDSIKIKTVQLSTTFSYSGIWTQGNNNQYQIWDCVDSVLITVDYGQLCKIDKIGFSWIPKSNNQSADYQPIQNNSTRTGSYHRLMLDSNIMVYNQWNSPNEIRRNLAEDVERELWITQNSNFVWKSRLFTDGGGINGSNGYDVYLSFRVIYYSTE